MSTSNKLSRLIIETMEFSRSKTVDNLISQRENGAIALTNEQIETISKIIDASNKTTFSLTHNSFHSLITEIENK